MTTERDALREQLAALAHTQWSGWMRYMVTRCVRVPSNGCLIIPAEWMERWQRQMNTAYADLPAHERQSDRAEADRVLALLPRGARDALIGALVAECADVLARRGAYAHPAILGQAEQSCYLHGVYSALERVAERLGATDLHARAADVVARGEPEP